MFVLKLKQRNDIEYLGDVKEAGWGQRSIKFYDPDGHIIEVGENLKMVVKRFLDSGMTMEETSKQMDVSISDLEKILKTNCYDFKIDRGNNEKIILNWWYHGSRENCNFPVFKK